MSLNSIISPKFISVRDRLALLLAKYKEKMIKKNKVLASNVMMKQKQRQHCLKSYKKEQAADLERKENSNTLTKKNKNDKASAEESRLKAMERLGQTRKRNAHTSCYGVTKPKRRGSTTKAVQILKEKFKSRKEIRKEEIELKKKEQENKPHSLRCLKICRDRTSNNTRMYRSLVFQFDMPPSN